MKKAFFFLPAVLFLSAQLYSQWVLQPTPTTQNLNSIVYVNATTLYASGEGEVILKTTNGGTNWVKLRENIGGKDYFSIWFVNENTGFAAGGLEIPTRTGLISKTTNGGVNWVDVVFSDICFRSAYFINASTGFMAGRTPAVSNSPIYITTNAGVNWFTVAPFNSYGVEDIFFFNASTGWANTITPSGWVVSKTTNGGYNWNTVSVIGETVWLRTVSFVNSVTGWISGNGALPPAGLLRKTTNGGTTWAAQVYHNSNVTYKTYFKNENTGWITGDIPNIQKTTNGGINWNIQTTPNASWMWDIKFINDNTGWSAGSQGKIFYTTNGGGPVSVQNISSEVPSEYSLKQNYPNPFNPSTNVKFSIVNSGLVKLTVYDVLGHEVQTLVNETLQPGTYETTFDGSMLPSGVYFCKLTSGDFSETKRLTLLK